MKIRTAIVLSCLVGVVLCIGYQSGSAAAGAGGTSSKIGIVSVRRVFLESQKNAKYTAEAMAGQAKTQAELEQLSKEITAEEAELKTLKPGTSDHLAQIKSLLEKRASMEAKQEYFKQERALRDKPWTEALYQDILRITKEVAKQKDLDVVLEGADPQFPVASEQLMLLISTHKLLYSGGCVDITSDVVARLDAAP